MADEDEVIRFPQTRVRSGRRRDEAPPRDLGLTALSAGIDPTGRGAKGHWCSRCRGIWYSFFLEAECPKCGNRHG